MSEAGGKHLLLVDDDVGLTEMLGDYLRGEGFSVDAVYNGEDAVAASVSGNYAAVILDIMLPRLSGMEALRRIRQKSEVPIIMLTAKGDSVDRVTGLEKGADDYVAKPYDPPELVARLRAVLRRQGRLSPNLKLPSELVLADLIVDLDTRRVQVSGRPVELTSSEFTLLAVLVAGGERVSSKEELSFKVLGRAREAYDRSLDVHVSNLRHKLAACTATVVIETVRGVGYRVVAAGGDRA